MNIEEIRKRHEADGRIQIKTIANMYASEKERALHAAHQDRGELLKRIEELEAAALRTAAEHPIVQALQDALDGCNKNNADFAEQHRKDQKKIKELEADLKEAMEWNWLDEYKTWSPEMLALNEKYQSLEKE